MLYVYDLFVYNTDPTVTVAVLRTPYTRILKLIQPNALLFGRVKYVIVSGEIFTLRSKVIIYYFRSTVDGLPSGRNNLLYIFNVRM